MRSCLTAMLLLAALPAHADMYKCKGADGKTTYQDTPCAAAPGEKMDIQTKRTDYYSSSASEIAAQRDIAAARELDRQYELRRMQAASEQRSRELDKRLSEDRDAYKWRAVGR